MGTTPTTKERNMASNSTHAVFAHTAGGTYARVTDPHTYDYALAEWAPLDAALRKGWYPHVDFFCVRSMDDPAFAAAPVALTYAMPVQGRKGYTSRRAAARAAWRATMGTRFHVRAGVGRERCSDAPGQATGVQGRGGWFYYPNGTTAAQGLDSLAAVCQRRGLMTQGRDGRWYVLWHNLDTAAWLRGVAAA